jgi:ADP-heptose:LPS heptosyltransferase
VVVGGADFDRELCEEIAAGFPRVRMFVGEGDLADYGALLARADEVLSVDTSAGHLAAAVGTKVTVLFGPGDPGIWAPRGRGEVKVLRAEADCLGCKAARCRRLRHRCMEGISVDAVEACLRPA